MLQLLFLLLTVASAAAFCRESIPRNAFFATQSFVPTTTTTTLSAARKPFISGNWKLNPQTRDEAIKLASDIASCITTDTPDIEVALFVPYVFIEPVIKASHSKFEVGAEVRSQKGS